MKNIDFNLAVYTTSDVVNQLDPIVIIYHDIDGDWQFFGSNVNEKNVAVVSLKQILEIAPHVFNLLDLPEGYKYEWNTEHQKWIKSFDG